MSVGRRAAAACVAVTAGVAALAGRAAPVRAEPHGSVGYGGARMLTADGGAPWRLEAEVDLLPGGDLGRYGVLMAARGVDLHHGLWTVGVLFAAAAARPRLVIELHADAGVDVAARAPVVGGGLRSVLGVWGPLGLAADLGGYLTLDGLDHSALALSAAGLGVVHW
jgi:hypothetical protein